MICCYIAEFFPITAGPLIGYFDVTWHLTIKLFPLKVSERTTVQNLWRQRVTVHCYPPMLTDDRRCCYHWRFFFLCDITNHLMIGPSGNNSFCFPRISMFPSAAPRGNIEILGKQNELFPSGPVIKCLIWHEVACGSQWWSVQFSDEKVISSTSVVPGYPRVTNEKS